MQFALVRNAVRWSILLVCIGVALLYLNHAFFSFWMSDGPPNPSPIGWGRRGIIDVSFAGAALFFGLALFCSVFTLPRVNRSAIVLLAFGILLIVAPYVGKYLLADDCLDRGGSWSNETIQCSNE